MNKNILKNRKAILSAALVIAATASAFAQGNGIAGINEDRPVDMYRLRRGIVLPPCMADLRAERPVR